MKSVFPEAQIRLDGSIRTKEELLLLPLIPNDWSKEKEKDNKKIELVFSYPEKSPILFLFSNGWFYISLTAKANDEAGPVLRLPPDIPEKIFSQLKNTRLPSDLIVPEGMKVENSLESTVGELAVGIEKNSTSKTKNQGISNNRDELPEGIIAISCPATGKIILLDPRLKKLSELTIDGTPLGMASIGKQIYIVDQSKNRILMVDTEKLSFSGQIDLPSGCSPNDIIAHPGGKFLYVTETATNTLAMIEVETKKVLIRTKMPAGPTKLAITPNSYTILVLSGASGKLSFVSTLNQKLVGILPIGRMPDKLAISNDGKFAYVSNKGAEEVAIVEISQRKLLDTVKTGEGPTGMCFSEDGSKLFVANARSNSISVIEANTRQKLRDIQLPLNVEFPGDLLLLPGRKSVLVSSAATDTTGIIDTDTLQFKSEEEIGYSSVTLRWVSLED